MKSVVSVPPASTTGLFVLAQSQLRLSNAAGRDYVNLLINACYQYAEDEMSCALLTQTITDTFYSGELPVLSNGPVISVTSVTDARGAITNYTVEQYGYSTKLVIPGGFTTPMNVVYQAGYASDVTTLPSKFVLAILTHVATMYLNRTSISDKQLTEVPQSLRDFYRNNSRNIPVA